MWHIRASSATNKGHLNWSWGPLQWQTKEVSGGWKTCYNNGKSYFSLNYNNWISYMEVLYTKWTLTTWRFGWTHGLQKYQFTKVVQITLKRNWDHWVSHMKQLRVSGPTIWISYSLQHQRGGCRSLGFFQSPFLNKHNPNVQYGEPILHILGTNFTD